MAASAAITTLRGVCGGSHKSKDPQRKKESLWFFGMDLRKRFRYGVSLRENSSRLTKRQTGGKHVITETNARNLQKKERGLGAGKRTYKHEGRAETGDLPAEKTAE